MKKLLPLSIISLAAMVATPVFAGPGHRGEKVVDARDLRGDINEAERSLNNLRNSLRRICRRDCRGVRSELNKIEASLKSMERTLKQARRPGKQPTAHHGPRALTNIEFSHLRTRLFNDGFDSKRLDRLSRERPVMPVHMVTGVLATFHYDSSRISALRILAPMITDPHNYTLIDGAFRNRSTRDEARRIVASRSRSGSGAIAQAPRTSPGRGRRAP